MICRRGKLLFTSRRSPRVKHRDGSPIHPSALVLLTLRNVIESIISRRLVPMLTMLTKCTRDQQRCLSCELCVINTHKPLSVQLHWKILVSAHSVPNTRCSGACQSVVTKLDSWPLRASNPTIWYFPSSWLAQLVQVARCQWKSNGVS